MMARRVVFAWVTSLAIATAASAAGPSTSASGANDAAMPPPPAESAAQVRGQVSGDVILTVTGLDPKRYPGGHAVFDMTALAALGPVEITTSSIWTDGKHTYTGVPLKALARALNLTAETVSLHALNDYMAEIPLSEAEDEAPILAYMMDGAPMSVRDKGPIWVIYPYDKDPAYRSDTAFARSVWQLDRIDVLR